MIESAGVEDGSGGNGPLPYSFYARPVNEVAQELIGCVVSHAGSAGVIVETEAYHDSEPASHAFVGVTKRTSTLFGPPGKAYVYLSYGIHELLNAVCEEPGIGAAVLIRALEPLDGIAQMAARRGIGKRSGGDGGLSTSQLRNLCSGPGKLTQALGITLADNGSDLISGPVTIRPRPQAWANPDVAAGIRIGITKAVELPWRYGVAGSRYLSRPL